jgi:hypothetical protein
VFVWFRSYSCCTSLATSLLISISIDSKEQQSCSLHVQHGRRSHRRAPSLGAPGVYLVCVYVKTYVSFVHQPPLTFGTHNQLAIVNMSDQYTRITSGGSPLDRSAPVVGLLFGVRSTGAATRTNSNSSNNNNNSSVVGVVHHLRIMDSDDIPVTTPATMQISLHQAVFPLHQVVGWYRVASSSATTAGPTADDVHCTAQLQQRHASAQVEPTHTTPTADDDDRIVFALLTAPADPPAADTTTNNNNNPNNKELPLQLYQLSETRQSFICLEQSSSWSLAMSDPERVAIEHVVRAQPLRLQRTTVVASSSSSAFGERAQDIQYSYQMVQTRLGALEQYLAQVVDGHVPWNPVWMRHIQGLLVYQLGPMANVTPTTTTDSGSSSMVLHQQQVQQLAVLAETVDAVASYMDKFRVVHDSKTTPARSGQRGRGFAQQQHHHHHHFNPHIHS